MKAYTRLCMHSEFEGRDQCNVHKHVVFRKLKSQTVWRIWCFVWYVSFGLFLRFILHVFVLLAAVVVDDVFFFFILLISYFERAFDAVSCSMCGYMNT